MISFAKASVEHKPTDFLSGLGQIDMDIGSVGEASPRLPRSGIRRSGLRCPAVVPTTDTVPGLSRTHALHPWVWLFLPSLIP